MKTITAEEIDDCIAKCTKRATHDKLFRQQLIENPHETIRQFLQLDIPQGIQIKIIENDPDYDYTLVLPDMIHSELNTSDLDDIAAGVSCDVKSIDHYCDVYYLCNRDGRK